MLIVDSPFPPYSLVEVDAYAEPKGDDDIDELADNSFRWFWANGAKNDYEVGDITHRSGGLPAVTRGDGLAHYFIYGVSHRRDGLAVIAAGRGNGVEGRFFLYGVRLSEDEFVNVNRLAYTYNLPLWVAVVAVKFKNHLGDLDKLAEVTVKATKGLQELNVNWLFKLWGLDSSYWDEDVELTPFEKMVSGMQVVIDFERTEK